VVAVVGRPNVGKSSLVNRIIGRREAIVQATPGVTRDRRAFEAEWGGRRFELVDTGGLETGASGLEERVADQAKIAMDAADLIVFVVDSTTGPLQDDVDVAAGLRRATTPVVLAVNKVDRPNDPAAGAEFHSLGLGDPLPVSALHGHGSGDLLDRVVRHLPAVEEPGNGAWASVAIVGRPNVGKSSLSNALLGEERSLVDPVPGTTRDPVDAVLTLPGGEQLQVVDTAGMRKRVRITDPIEYFSWLRTQGTLDRVDAALLVVDAVDGVTGLDQRLAREIMEAGRACVVALNKWDLVTAEGPDRERFEDSLTRSLRFLGWATVRRTSAVTRRGVDKLLPALVGAIGSHRARIPTAVLNRLIRDAQASRPHPRTRGGAVRVLYAVQARSAPPTILLFANHRLEEGYVRYLERSLRAAHPFPGSPIHLEVRIKSKS
jgi:GTP-binding protein